MSNTFSIAQDIDGVLVIQREYLKPPDDQAGGVTVAPSGIYQITALSALKRGNLQRLEAVCIAPGIAPGFFHLRSLSGPTTGPPADNFRTLHVGTPTTGDRFVWEFPTPLQSFNTVRPFHIEVPTGSPSIGTFFFTAEGYYTSVPQD